MLICKGAFDGLISKVLILHLNYIKGYEIWFKGFIFFIELQLSY